MKRKITGLRYWMAEVLEECEYVSADFSADPVHDLRVALRRCRSIADGMMAMDPDREWKAMKKAGKALFQRLGSVRDVQIMMEWIERLHPAQAGAMAPVLKSPDRGRVGEAGIAGTTPVRLTRSDPAAQALFQILQGRENEQKHEARAALDEFDRKQWRQWSKSLPLRAMRVRPGSPVFKHLALERWTTARELHIRALRNRSQSGFHTLRIGIKRFRYIVENFLPEQYKSWSNDLKHMQDLLGEVHDLDVLWATALSCHVFGDDASHNRWHERIFEERTRRIDEYRERTVGSDSLWYEWRSGLPQDRQIQQIALQRMKLWAKALDPDFAHSERVARLALELYDGLISRGVLGDGTTSVTDTENQTGADARSSLQTAALLHDVGKSRGQKKHHKESLELIRAHGVPLGWKAEVMNRAAIVARFHDGALPSRSHKALRDLLPNEQKITIQLAAILRLANALDVEHDGHVRRVRVEPLDQGRGAAKRVSGFLRKPAKLAANEALVLDAEGLVDGSATAQAVAAERYLLEMTLRRPVVVRAMRSGTTPRIAAPQKKIAL